MGFNINDNYTITLRLSASACNPRATPPVTLKNYQKLVLLTKTVIR